MTRAGKKSRRSRRRFGLGSTLYAENCFLYSYRIRAKLIRSILVLAITMLWAWPCLGQELRVPHLGTPAKRSIEFSDLSAEFRPWLRQWGISELTFADFIQGIDRRTAERELNGEYDHLIFYLLQSQSFTTEPKIEPALSANEFVQRLNPGERALYLADGQLSLPSIDRLPRSVARRMADFLAALDHGSTDERLSYFTNLLHRTENLAEPLLQHLYAEYARGMKFLYRKEFLSHEENRPQPLAAYLASLYQERGHSTDTQIEANFAVYVALAALKAQAPATRLRRVLIVGPGLDFAPRTDLIDLFGPQSYQPFAVADALLGLKLADLRQLRIHCIDINDRVVAYLRGFSQRKDKQLFLLSGVAESAAQPLSDDFKRYFEELGKNIGTEDALEMPTQLSSRLSKSLRIRPEVADLISVDKLNLITERYDPSPHYDLAIVTNVFPYFNTTELLLALTNVSLMISEGGYLIHNEMRDSVSAFGEPLGLPLKQARTVLIAAGRGRSTPLYDSVAMHQKSPSKDEAPALDSNDVRQFGRGESACLYRGRSPDAIRYPRSMQQNPSSGTGEGRP